MDLLVLKAKKDLALRSKKPEFTRHKLIGTSPGILSINVTSKLVSRSLKFMDQIIIPLKSKGFEIGYKVGYGTIVIKDKIELPIRLREKCKRQFSNENSWRTSELVPTGILIFALDAIPRKEWEDSKNKSLEMKIPNIVKYLEEKVRSEINLQNEIKVRNQELEARKKSLQEIKQQKEIEYERFKALIDESEKWHRAKRLREYIDAVIRENSNVCKMPLTERDKWIRWAKQKANEIDPLMNNSCIR